MSLACVASRLRYAVNSPINCLMIIFIQKSSFRFTKITAFYDVYKYKKKCVAELRHSEVNEFMPVIVNIRDNAQTQ